MRRVRGGRRSAGVAPQGIIGHRLTTANNRYVGAASQGIRGSASGFYVAWLVAWNAITAFQLGPNISSGDGWLWMPSASDTLRFRVKNGSGGSVDSPAFTMSAFLGKVVSLVGVHTGTHVRMYANGSEVGSGTAITGYTSPGTAAMWVGGAAVNDYVFCGLQGGDGVPSAANILAWSQACRAANAMVAMPGVAPQHAWLPLATVGNISDSVGTDTLTQVGTPVATRVQWGF